MPNSLLKKLHFVPETIASAGAKNFDARGFSIFIVLAPAGTTVTFSRVMTMAATGHNNDPVTAQETVASNTMNAEVVDWPFYRVSAANGPCQVAFV
jgi:hypothetical protein